MTEYSKLFISLRYYLIGRGYFEALKALSFARQHHSGTRKDGVTPEFQHQVEIALFITTLPGLGKNEEKVIMAAILHDVMEDYNVSRDEMVSLFGEEMTEIVWLLTKKFGGMVKDKDFYFSEMSNNLIAAMVKGADRIHNVQSMVGVFTLEKQKQYLLEVEFNFLPMLKKAKYSFPEYTAAYFNIIHMLKSQVELIHASHEALPISA